MSNFNDEVCEYSYSSVTENFGTENSDNMSQDAECMFRCQYNPEFNRSKDWYFRCKSYCKI